MVPYKAKWYRREKNMEDPWISLKDYSLCKSKCILYGGNEFGKFGDGTDSTAFMSSNDGADVFITLKDETTPAAVTAVYLTTASSALSVLTLAYMMA